MGKEEAPEPVGKKGDDTASKLSKISPSEIDRQAEEWESERGGSPSKISSSDPREYLTDPLVTTDPLTLPGNRDETLETFHDAPENPRQYFDENRETISDKFEDIEDDITETDNSCLGDLTTGANLTSSGLSTVKGLKDSIERIESAILKGKNFEIPSDLEPPGDSPLLPVLIKHISEDVSNSPGSISSPMFHRDIDISSIVPDESSDNLVTLRSSSDVNINKMFDIVNSVSLDKSIIDYDDEIVPNRQVFDSIATSDEDSLLLSSSEDQKAMNKPVEVSPDEEVSGPYVPQQNQDVDNDNLVDSNAEENRVVDDSLVENSKSLLVDDVYSSPVQKHTASANSEASGCTSNQFLHPKNVSPESPVDSLVTPDQQGCSVEELSLELEGNKATCSSGSIDESSVVKEGLTSDNDSVSDRAADRSSDKSTSVHSDGQSTISDESMLKTEIKLSDSVSEMMFHQSKLSENNIVDDRAGILITSTLSVASFNDFTDDSSSMIDIPDVGQTVCGDEKVTNTPFERKMEEFELEERIATPSLMERENSTKPGFVFTESEPCVSNEECNHLKESSEKSSSETNRASLSLPLLSDLESVRAPDELEVYEQLSKNNILGQLTDNKPDQSNKESIKSLCCKKDILGFPLNVENVTVDSKDKCDEPEMKEIISHDVEEKSNIQDLEMVVEETNLLIPSESEERSENNIQLEDISLKPFTGENGMKSKSNGNGDTSELLMNEKTFPRPLTEDSTMMELLSSENHEEFKENNSSSSNNIPRIEISQSDNCINVKEDDMRTSKVKEPLLTLSKPDVITDEEDSEPTENSAADAVTNVTAMNVLSTEESLVCTEVLTPSPDRCNVQIPSVTVQEEVNESSGKDLCNIEPDNSEQINAFSPSEHNKNLPSIEECTPVLLDDVTAEKQDMVHLPLIDCDVGTSKSDESSSRSGLEEREIERKHQDSVAVSPEVSEKEEVISLKEDTNAVASPASEVLAFVSETDRSRFDETNNTSASSESVKVSSISSSVNLAADQENNVPEVSLVVLDKDDVSSSAVHSDNLVVSLEDSSLPSVTDEIDNINPGETSNSEESTSLKNVTGIDSSEDDNYSDLNVKLENFDLSMIKIEEMNLEERIAIDSSGVVLRRKPHIYPSLLKTILKSSRAGNEEGKTRSRQSSIEKIAEKLGARTRRVRPIAPKPPVISSSKSDAPIKPAEVLASALVNADSISKIMSAVEILRVDSPDAVRKKPDLTPSVSLIPAEMTLKSSPRETDLKLNSSNHKKASTTSSISPSVTLLNALPVKEPFMRISPPPYLNLSGVNIELRNVPTDGSSKVVPVGSGSVMQPSSLPPSNIPPNCLSSQMTISPVSLPSQANFPPTATSAQPFPALPSQSHPHIPPPVPLQRFSPPLNIPLCFPPPPTIPQVIPKPRSNRKTMERMMPHHKFIEAFYRTKSGTIKKKYVKVPFTPMVVSQVFPDGTAQLSPLGSPLNPVIEPSSEPSALKQPTQSSSSNSYNLSNVDVIYSKTPAQTPIIPQPILSLMQQTDQVQTDEPHHSKTVIHSNLEMIPITRKDNSNPVTITRRNSLDSQPSKNDNRTGAIEFRQKEVEVPKRVLDVLLHENKTEMIKTDMQKTDLAVMTKTQKDTSKEQSLSLASATSSLLKLSKAVPAGSEEVVFNSNDLKVILVQPESELHSSKKGSLLPLCENTEKQGRPVETGKTLEEPIVAHERNPDRISKKKKRGSLDSLCEKLTILKNTGVEAPIQIRDTPESIAPSKSPDIVLLPKSVADQTKHFENTDSPTDKCVQILKVPKFNVADELTHINEPNQFISLFSLSQRNMEKSVVNTLVNTISDDSQSSSGAISKSSSPINVPEHGGRSGMVSRKSTGRRKTSDPADALRKSRSRISGTCTPPPPPPEDSRKIILSDVGRGCGGEVSVVELPPSVENAGDTLNNGGSADASDQQEQQDAIYRLRRLGTDVSLEDQKVTKNLRGGDTVLVTPIEDGEHQPPAIKLLEDMAKSTELPVSSPVLTALGQQTVKPKRKNQPNPVYEPSKFPPLKENITKSNVEIQNSSVKATRSKSDISNSSSVKSALNGENTLKVVIEKISVDSQNKLPDCKVTNVAQATEKVQNPPSDCKVQQNTPQSVQIVTRSSVQQQNSMQSASGDQKNPKVDEIQSDQKAPQTTERVQKPEKVQHQGQSPPQNQKVTRSSVQQQNSMQSVPDDKSKVSEEKVQKSIPQSTDKVQNHSATNVHNQKVTRSSVQNSNQLRIAPVEDEIKPDAQSKITKLSESTENVTKPTEEDSQENEKSLSEDKMDNHESENGDTKTGDGVFLIRPQHYVKVVDGEQVWCCDICTVVCSQLPLFRKHYLRLHISSKFISERDKEVLNIIEDDSDRDSKNIFKCHVCKDNFDKKADLKVHLQNHPKMTDNSQTSKSLKQYVCPHCDAVFKWRKHFGKHKKMCQESIRNSTKPSHHCLYCNETFFTPIRKKNHILSCHPYTRRKHPCIFCSKVFQSNIILFNHLVSYHSSVFFGCTMCKERYLNLTELKAHFKKLHPTENLKVKNSVSNPSDRDFYRCDKCDRVFLIENCLNKHNCTKNIDVKEKSVKKVQKRIKPLLIEQKIDGYKPSGETEFYSKVSTNIRDNLTYHLDGKLHPVEPPSNVASSHRTILNFNAGVQPTVVPTPLQEKPVTKSPNTPTYEKFSFPKEYDGRCGLTSFIKDASYLDISTQLIMRRNLQRLNLLSQTSPDPQWDVPASLALERLGAQCAESFGITDPPQDDSTGEDGGQGGTAGNSLTGELSGEWVRERTYVCSTCLWQTACLWAMEDHKYSAHPHVWCPQHELNTPNHKHIASFAYRRLIDTPKEEKKERTPSSRKEKYECTKCNASDIKTKQDLHRHILECVGEDLAALEVLHNAAVVRLPTAKKRSRWRGGSRRTRQGLKRNIPSTPPAHHSKRYKKLLRTKPGDADTIEKMIANLPAKRATRRVLGFDEIDIKTRSQATIQNSTTAPSTSQMTKKHVKPSQNSPPKKMEKKVQGIDTSAENGNVLSSLRMMPVKKMNDVESTDSMPTLEIEEEIGPGGTSNSEIPVLTPATTVPNQIMASAIPLPTPVLPPSTTAILLLVPPLQQQPPPLVPIKSSKDEKTVVKSKISEPNQICSISVVQGKVKLSTNVPQLPIKVQAKQILNLPVQSTFPKVNRKKLAVPPPEQKKKKKRGRPMGSKNKSKLNRVKKEELKKTAGNKKLRGWWLKEHSKDLKHSSSNKLKGWWLKELTQKAKTSIESKMKGQGDRKKKVVKRQTEPKEEAMESEEVATTDKVEIKQEKVEVMEAAVEEVVDKRDTEKVEEVTTGENPDETKDSPKEQDGSKKRKRKSDPEEDKQKQEKLELEKKRKQEEKKAKEEERLRKSAEKKRLIEEKKQKREEAKRLREEEKKKKEEEKRKKDEEKRLEEEKKKKAAEEEKKKKQAEEEERKRKEDEERIKREEEEKKKRQEEEAKRKAEEDKKKKEEELKRREEEKKKKEEDARKRKEEEMKRKEEEKKRKEEEIRKRKEEEAKRKEEEKKRREEEAKKRKEEEAKRKEEEKKKKEEELKKRKEEEAKKRKEEEARRKEEEARKRKEEEARRKEEEAKKRKEEEARRKEEEAKKRKEEEAKRKEEEAKKRKEEEARRKEEEAKKRKEEEEARRKEEEAKKRKEEEAKRKEEELKRKEEEARKAEEEKKRKEEERKKAEEKKRKEEEEKKRIERERKCKEEEERKRIEEERKRKEMEALEKQRQAEEEAKKQREEEESRRKEEERLRLEAEEVKRLEEECQGGAESPASGGSSPKTGDDSKLSDSDSQKSFKMQQQKKRKKQMDLKMKKLNRMSLAQMIRRKRLLMKMKESGATASSSSTTGKEVVSSGMKWEVEVRPEPPRVPAVPLPSTPLPEEMDWLSGVAPSATAVKLVPTTTLTDHQLMSQSVGVRQQNPLVHPTLAPPPTMSHTMSTSGTADNTLWRDQSYQSSPTPNLGSILDSVNTLLNEPDLTMYTPLVQPAMQPPQYSLADLQRAMGASDAEMAVLQQLGEIKVEEQKEEDWSEINIIDLDKQTVPTAPQSENTLPPVAGPAVGRNPVAQVNIGTVPSATTSDNTGTTGVGWMSRPSTSLPNTPTVTSPFSSTGIRGQVRGSDKRPNCALVPRGKDGSSALLALHPGKEVVCPTCSCHFMGFPALQLHISKYHPSRPSPPRLSLLDKVASVRRMSANICHKQDLSMLNKRALLESAKGSRMVCFMCQQILPSNLMSSHLVVEHSAKPADITKCHLIADPVSSSSNEVVDGGERLKNKMSSALGDLLDRAVNNLLTAKQDTSNRMTGGAIQLLNKLCALRKKEGSHHRLHPSAKDMLLKVYAKNRLEAALKKGAQKGIKPGNFTCGICGETFLWEATWNKHVLDIHTRPCGMPNVDEMQSDPDEPEEDGWRSESDDEATETTGGTANTQSTPLVPVCSNCGLGFESITELIAHRNEIHKPKRRGSAASLTSKAGSNSRASSNGPPSRCSTPATLPSTQASVSGSQTAGTSPETSSTGVPPPPSISPAPTGNDVPPPIIVPEVVTPRPRLTRSSASYFNPPTPPPPILTPEGDLMKEVSAESSKSSGKDSNRPSTVNTVSTTSTGARKRGAASKTAVSSSSKKETTAVTATSQTGSKSTKPDDKVPDEPVPQKTTRSTKTSSRASTADTAKPTTSQPVSTPSSVKSTQSSGKNQSSGARSTTKSGGPAWKRRRRRGSSPECTTRPKRRMRSHEDENIRKRAEVALRELNLTHKAKHAMNMNTSATSVRWTSAMTFSPRPKAETTDSPPNPPSTSSSAATAIYDFHEDQPS